MLLQVSKTLIAATAACEEEGLGPWPAERVVRLGHSLGGKVCAILACEVRLNVHKTAISLSLYLYKYVAKIR